MNRKKEKGFSLVELLVVVIIIAIVAAIAIPNLLASRRAGNEASAINSLRTYHSAEVTYYATIGGNNTYALATDLGLAGLVDPVLAGAPPTKSGYDFVLNIGSGTYCATAAPSTPGTTGNSYYGVSVDGVIYKDSAALVCSNAGVLTVSGNPIQ